MGLESLLSIIKDYSSKDKELIIRAFEFASRAHLGVMRKSGEPYIIHPLSVAIILAEMHADADTIAAGLLHDCIEDVAGINSKVIAEQFNPTVAYLVEGVTKIDKMTVGNNKVLAENESNKKLIKFMCNDIRILIIKLADRLHNMRTLQFHDSKKQKEIAQETLDIYVPFAELIGAYNIKLELEDLAFYYLHHQEYVSMVKLTRELKCKKRSILDEVLCGISQLLNSKDITYNVELTVKNYYGLYNRLSVYHEPQNVHDLFQIKYLLDDIGECYKLRDDIKKIYLSLADKSKDYIINPKTNMYRALHTSAYVKPDSLVQFQIATPNMDAVNSHGLTAIWNQKRITNPAEQMQHDFKELPIFPIIKEIVACNTDAAVFNQEIRENVLGEKVYVTTPKDEVKELPAGSTPIDFAYYIHTDIGDHFVMAKVNGIAVAPDYKLNNKDCVEIVTANTKTPDANELLRWCTTSHARRCVKGIKKRELKQTII